jgi:hypothetical protein
MAGFVADNDKVDVAAVEEFCSRHQRCVVLDGAKTLSRQRQHSFNEHHNSALSFL